ncbi:MAG: hypothetical protein ACW98Y_11940, partial [Candidatus Thorarchaeota archaeon]
MRKGHLLFFVLLLLTPNISLSIQDYNREAIQSIEGSQLKSELADLTPHDPVKITSDSDFILQGWPGEGTEESPYRVEDLIIKSNGTVPCIQISGVSSSFIVSQCDLSGSRTSNGAAYFTGNGTIKDCFIHNSTVGIMVVNDGQIEGELVYWPMNIEDNQINNISSYAINPQGYNIEIMGNNVSINNQPAIKFWNHQATDTRLIVHGNYLRNSGDNSYPLLDIEGSNVDIRNNILDSNYRSLQIKGNNILVKNNSFIVQKGVSLVIQDCENITVQECYFTQPTSLAYYGCQINGRNITISNCVFNQVLMLIEGQDISVSGCRFSCDFLELSYGNMCRELSVRTNTTGFDIYRNSFNAGGLEVLWNSTGSIRQNEFVGPENWTASIYRNQINLFGYDLNFSENSLQRRLVNFENDDHFIVN